MPAGYLDHLDRISDEATWRRKLDYYRFNFAGDLEPGQAVLEVGPGRGELLQFTRERRVAFVDIIDRDAEIAARIAALPGVRRAFVAAAEDLDSISHELGTYDRIFLLNVLEHVTKPCAVQLVRGLYQHLLPGGRLLATVPNGANPLAVVERYSDFTHECLYTEESLRQLVDVCALPGARACVRGYRIPPVDLLNRVRIVVQKCLHLFLKGLLVANGGVHFSLYEPNITLVLVRDAQ